MARISANMFQSLVQKDDIFYDVVNFGASNTYPQVVDECVMQSPLTGRCVEISATFTAGDGFADVNFAKTVVNESGETWADILDFCASEFAKFNGFALHIERSITGAIAEITPVPFQYCRVTTNYSAIAVKDDWAGESRQLIPELMPVYYPKFGTQRLNSFFDFRESKGEIFYFSLNGNFRKPYSESTVHAILSDIQADIEMSKYRLNGAKNNFSATMICETINSPTETERIAIQNELRKLQGAENAGSIAFLTGGIRNPDGGIETAYKFTPINIPQIDGMFDKNSAQIQANILRNFGIPPVLFGMQDSSNLNSSTDAIKGAYQYLNNIMLKRRNELARQLSKVAQREIILLPKKYLEL